MGLMTTAARLVFSECLLLSCGVTAPDPVTPTCRLWGTPGCDYSPAGLARQRDPYSDSSMYGAVNYIREKDCPEGLQIHPMWSTPKCWIKAWRNRDGPRGVSHTAEWDWTKWVK